MLSPQGEAPSHGDPGDDLDVSPEALVERLRRRVAALERQLDTRIEQVSDLHARLAGEERRAAAARAEAAALRAEHDALLATFTMRALRRPREWYGAARRLRRP